MVQFTAKRDQQHEAMLAKYGGLRYAEIDKDSKIGTLSHDCPVQEKQQRKKGLKNEYHLLAEYEGFDTKK